MLVVEQNVSIAASVAEQIYVVDAGQLITVERADRIFDREDLMRTYLGITETNCTGPEYSVYNNAVLVLAGAACPGNTPGTTASGGQVVA